MEPWREAELREQAWDRKCAEYPVCDICGESVYQYDTCLVIDGKIYCKSCIEENTNFVEDMID